MKYILDTNICIYIIKRKPAQVFEKFKNLSLGSVGISSITLAELTYGVKKSAQPEKNQIALTQFLIPLEIIDFDTNAAMEYGKIRTELERSGIFHYEKSLWKTKPLAQTSHLKAKTWHRK